MTTTPPPPSSPGSEALTPDESAGKAAREWASFIADDGDTWHFDMTFFRSSYRCIYGQGCQGIEKSPTRQATVGAAVTVPISLTTATSTG